MGCSNLSRHYGGSVSSDIYCWGLAERVFRDRIENLSLWIEKGLVAAQVNEVIRSLIVDGILAGVGGILTFLPNIFILFLALAF